MSNNRSLEADIHVNPLWGHATMIGFTGVSGNFLYAKRSQTQRELQCLCALSDAKQTSSRGNPAKPTHRTPSFNNVLDLKQEASLLAV